jgi:hypothetical protein
MLVPAGMAESLVSLINRGIDAVRIPRLIFYIDQPESEHIWTEYRFDGVGKVARVIQNNRTPVAVTREAYFKIGGHDESFFGWGGEDDEMMDRLRTLTIGEGAFLPFVHLWHAEAPNRGGDRNSDHLVKRLSIPSPERARQMAAVPFGQAEPTVAWLSSHSVSTYTTN